MEEISMQNAKIQARQKFLNLTERRSDLEGKLYLNSNGNRN